MKMYFPFITLVVSFMLIHTPRVSAQPDAAPALRVMSFNLRYGTANDGDNHWDKRKELLVETIKAFNPDLLGTQETLAFQRDYLLKNMEGYEAFGVSREDGKDKGEMTTVLYRKDRFEKLEGATFWLSETPDAIASKGWDTSLPRICTWIKLRDLKVKDAPPVYFYNTHFDHRGSKARLESAKLIRRHIAALGAEARVVLTGDFNADEGSEPYKALFAEHDGKASPVLDTLRVFKPQRGDDEGSFNSFGPAPRPTPGSPGSPGKARIDWVAVSRQWTVTDAAIDRTHKNGRWPSDHFPVTAVIKAK